MNRAAIIIAVLLSACGSAPVWRDAAGNAAPAQAVAECDYEASKATAGIRSGMEQGYMTGQLRSQCLVVRGYRRGG